MLGGGGVCKTAENWGSGQWWLELWVNRNVWKKTHPMRENEREKIKQSVIFCVLSLLLLSRETDTVTLGAYMPTKVPGMTLCIK